MVMAPGSKIGAYEILAKLGQGGMGEVYRARDQRVKRDVAIKISNTAFTERFQLEAEAIAALSHPNVCTLFDVGPDYLVMELVEGPTLADLLSKGPLPMAEALRIAAQIADALEAAHAKHVVHRDLKPGNVKIRPDGLVKVLDFGLAKMGGAAGGSQNDSPTLTMGMTEAGMILGTAGYMAPEQARGEAVDHRADVWGFGVLLYEMLSGARLYDGATASDTLAAVLLKEPDWSRVPASELSSIGRLLRWCLEKEPRKRLSDIAMAKRLLVEDPAPTMTNAPARASSRLWPAIAAMLASLLVGGASYTFWPKAALVPESTVFQIPAPPGAQFAGDIAVSPNGRQIAIVVRDNNNRTSLWLRSLDSLEAQMLASPNEAQVQAPFWSPDGQWIAYVADGRLKRVPRTGGAPQVLCTIDASFRGGSWGTRDTIVFATFLPDAALWKVAAGGGTPTRLKSTPSQVLRTPRNPAFLPDGNHFLFGLGGERLTDFFLGSLDTPSEQWPALALAAEGQPTYLPPPSGASTGVLVFPNGGALMTQPFDPATFTLLGTPARVVGSVANSQAFSSDYSASPSGTLVYRAGGETLSRLTWTDRMGTVLSRVGEGTQYAELQLSPDGKRLAAVRDGDIWLIDLERGTNLRLTSTPAQERAPVWTTDGASIVFASDRSGHLDLYEKLADSTAAENLVLATPRDKVPSGFSPDGRWLLFSQDMGGANDVMMLSRAAGTADVKPLLTGPAQEGQATVSPDGRWVAYASLESGQIQTYIRSFPDGRNPRKVMEGQAAEPRWARNGELFLRSNVRGNTLFSVALNAAGELGTPRSLFTSTIVGAGGFSQSPNYLPSPDGQRILGMLRGANEPSAPLVVVTNWRAPHE